MEKNTAKYGLIALVVLFVIVISWDIYEYSKIPAPASVTTTAVIPSLRLIMYLLIAAVLSILSFVLVLSYSNLGNSKTGSIITGVIALITLAAAIYGLYRLQVFHSNADPDDDSQTIESATDLVNGMHNALFITGLAMLAQAVVSAVYAYWIHKDLVTRGPGGTLLAALRSGPERSDVRKPLVATKEVA